MSSAEPHYDIFISYPHFDVAWVTSFVKSLELRFEGVTGRPPSIFFDASQVTTAQLWRERIESGITNSKVLIAVLSPSYFKSEWCAKEWDTFSALETQRRTAGEFAPDVGLIFSIKLHDWDGILGPSKDQTQRIEEAGARQYVSFEGVEPSSESTSPFCVKVHELTRQIVAVLKALRTPTNIGRETRPSRNDKAPPTRSQLLTRIGTNREEFIARLSTSTRVTIVGITHQNLGKYLEEAIRRMRRVHGSNAFWQELRIVFLSERMLSHVDDELTNRFHGPDYARDRRAQHAREAKGLLYRILSREDRPEHWSIFEYDAMLPFLGESFVQSDGQKVVQAATIRPGLRTSEHLFFEFSGVASDITYYEAAFEEVVRRSTRHDEIVLLGYPDGAGFVSTKREFLHDIPISGENRSDWIAAVMIILLQNSNGNAVPLLQFRTTENSTRELDLLSNVCGYINTRDLEGACDGDDELSISESVGKKAAHRELVEELGTNRFRWMESPKENMLRFYATDRENIYFYVYVAELQIPYSNVRESACLRPWTLPDILDVRKYQVLCNALHLLSPDIELKARQWSAAAKLIADNLVLHDCKELANQLTQLKGHVDEQRSTLQELIARMLPQSERTCVYRNEDRQILGLAGLQYREFFTAIVPTYKQLGVSGAAECLETIEQDPDKQQALQRLKRYYQDIVSIGGAAIDV